MAADESGNSAQEAAAVAAVQAANYAAADALLQLEQQAVDAALAGQRTAQQQLMRQSAAQYALMFGSIENPADPARAAILIEPIRQELERLAAADYTTSLRHYADLALHSGVQYANRHLASPVAPQSVGLSESVGAAIGGVAQSVADTAARVQIAYDQLEISGFSDLATAVSRAATVANPVKQAAAWTVNRASSDGMAAVAARSGAHLLWVAERDACVVCLALSGHLSDPSTGETFDEDATFGKPGSAPAIWPLGDPLTRPPRHPFCRCHMELWFGPFSTPFGPQDNALYRRPDIAAGVDLPAALRREAKRSVLRGWSLPSESQAVRLSAADRLLQRGAGMPKSVEDRAVRAVRNRRFTDRSVPPRR